MSVTENCTISTPKFPPLSSLISNVCPDHNIEGWVLCLNPGTFDLNLRRGKIERQPFLNVTYQEVLSSFLCKNKFKKTNKQTNQQNKLFELPYCVGKQLWVTLTLTQEGGSPQRQSLHLFRQSSPHIDKAAKTLLSLSRECRAIQVNIFYSSKICSACRWFWMYKYMKKKRK